MTRILLAALAALLASSAAALGSEADPYRVAPEQKPTFELLRVEEAWQITRGGPECPIGVVDSGFDFFHPALRGQLVPASYAPGVYHTTSASLIGHGTLVAGLLVAHNVGEDGMVGFAPGCHVLAASTGMPEHGLLLLQQRFRAEHPEADMAAWQEEMRRHPAELQAFNETWLEYVAATMAGGITALVDGGARVINISGFLPTSILASRPGCLERVTAAFAYAAERDVLIVIGSGNTATEVVDYPGTAETVLVAGASTLADERWEEKLDVGGMEVTQGSCYGPRLSVLAPAEDLRIAQPHEKASYEFADTPMGREDEPFEAAYATLPSGATSSATAIVSALAALVRSLRPDLTARDTVRIIEETAVDLGAPGFDPMTGHGRIDFLAALTRARDWPTPAPGE